MGLVADSLKTFDTKVIQPKGIFSLYFFSISHTLSAGLRMYIYKKPNLRSKYNFNENNRHHSCFQRSKIY